jgi:hypothetical protein
MALDIAVLANSLVLEAGGLVCCATVRPLNHVVLPLV